MFATLSICNKNRVRSTLVALISLGVALTLNFAIATVATAQTKLTWDDLVFEGFSLEIAPVNEELDGDDVKLPGYVVPLEMDGEMVKEFLLVPYAGACIHTPPPPLNQIVHVVAKEPFKSMMHRQPVWATGLMKVGKRTSSVGYYNAESGYQMIEAEVETYK